MNNNNLIVINKHDDCFNDLQWVLKARMKFQHRFQHCLIVEYTKVWCTDNFRLHCIDKPEEFDFLQQGLYIIDKCNKSEIVIHYSENEEVRPNMFRIIPNDLKCVLKFRGSSNYSEELYNLYKVCDVCVNLNYWIDITDEGFHYDVYYSGYLKPLMLKAYNRMALLMPIKIY